MDAKLQLMLTARDMTASAFASFQGRIQRATRMLTSFSGVLGGIAGVGSLGGLAMLTKRTLDFSDSLAKTADKIGLSTDNLQIYRYAAERSGVATSALDMGMQRFTRRLAEAAQGGGVLSEVFKQYNISARDANGAIRSTDAVLDDLAEAIRNAESDSERLRIAFKAFDSEGAALVNMLRGGKQGLDEYRANAQRLGIVIKEDLLRGAENANDAITDLQKVLDTSFKTAILTLAPDIERVVVQMTNWVGANREFITEDVPAYIGNLAEKIGEVKSAYDGIPDDIKNAAYGGLVGRVIWGKTAPVKLIMMLTLMNEQLDKMGMGVRGAAHSWRELSHHAKKAWETMPAGLKKIMTFSIADMLPQDQGVVPGEMSEHEMRRLGLSRPIVPGEMSEHEKRRLGLSSPPPADTPAPAAPGAHPWTAGDQFMEDMGLNDFSWFERAEQDRIDAAVKSHEEYINAVEEGFARHIGSQEKFFQKTQENSTKLIDLNTRTAWAMQESFSDLFFDALQGEMKSFEDYFAGFMRSLNRMFAEYMAQMLMAKAFGEAGGGAKGSGGGWAGMLVNFVGDLLTRDSGGPVRPGQMYEIGVPEMLHIGNKSYLMMGGNQGGHAEPLKQNGTAGAPTPPQANVRVINVLDPSIVEDWASTPAGEQTIMNIVSRNQ